MVVASDSHYIRHGFAIQYVVKSNEWMDMGLVVSPPQIEVILSLAEYRLEERSVRRELGVHHGLLDLPDE
jgi:hypothetical protein